MDLRQVDTGHVSHAIARVLERAAQLSGRSLQARAVQATTEREHPGTLTGPIPFGERMPRPPVRNLVPAEA